MKILTGDAPGNIVPINVINLLSLASLQAKPKRCKQGSQKDNAHAIHVHRDLSLYSFDSASLNATST